MKVWTAYAPILRPYIVGLLNEEWLRSLPARDDCLQEDRAFVFDERHEVHVVLAAFRALGHLTATRSLYMTGFESRASAGSRVGRNIANADV